MGLRTGENPHFKRIYQKDYRRESMSIVFSLIGSTELKSIPTILKFHAFVSFPKGENLRPIGLTVITADCSDDSPFLAINLSNGRESPSGRGRGRGGGASFRRV